MSFQPSLLISTTDAALAHLPSPATLATSVTSRKEKLSSFRYNLFDVVLAVKYKSANPLLSKSPTATPPPLYKNSRSSGFIESFSVTVLTKSIPVLGEDRFLNNVGRSCRQEFKKIKITSVITI